MEQTSSRENSSSSGNEEKTVHYIIKKNQQIFPSLRQNIIFPLAHVFEAAAFLHNSLPHPM
jgi:hypothetical protein